MAGAQNGNGGELRKLLHNLRKRRFKVDIVMVFCILIIPTVIIISSFTYYKTVDATLKITNSLVEKVSSAVIEKTTNYLKPAQVLAEIAPFIVKNPNMKVETGSELEKMFMEVLRIQPQIDLFYYGTEGGSFLQASSLDGDQTLKTKFINRGVEPPMVTQRFFDESGAVSRVTESTDVTYDPRARPWYKGAKATGKTYWTDLYIFFENNRPGITVASPVYNGMEQLQGIVAADITLDGISSFLRELDISEHGLVFIMDDKMQFVAFPDADRMVRIEQGSVQPIRAVDLKEEWITAGVRKFEDTGAARFTYESGGSRYLASFTPFPASFGKSWTIAVMLPEDDFLGAIRQTSRTIIMISVAILLLAILFGLVFARNLSRPIEALTEEVGRIRNFDLSATEPVSSYINEIQTMSDAVFSMKNGLRAFRRFVPADLVRQLVASGEEVQPGGKEREVTLFFSDIEGFTSISEQLPAKELMQDLSEYFEEMTGAITGQAGTLDKYIGDAVMAFWGAPVEDEEQAVHACRAALNCQRALTRLNAQRTAVGKMPFITRVGIHTGFTIVGNMGTSQRLNYTVLGDNVNLASRLEGVNKRYGTGIIISQATYRYVRNGFIIRPLDLVAVKGKVNSVLIYELMGDSESENKKELQMLANLFEQAFGLYLNRNWQEAGELFESLLEKFPDDIPTAMYARRCQDLLANDPGPDWSGIVRMNRGDYLLAGSSTGGEC